MNKAELVARIAELESENQRLKESLEYREKLLNEALKGLCEWNGLVFPNKESDDANRETADGRNDGRTTGLCSED